MMKPTALLAVFSAFLAAGCASTSTPAARAARELRFGARVARNSYWQEARFRFQEAVKLDPSNARAHNNLAVSMEALGEFSAAFEEYKKAVSLAPNNRDIRDNYTKFAEFYASYSKTVGKVPRVP
jgi:Tfp pilus assembly protein PilF